MLARNESTCGPSCNRAAKRGEANAEGPFLVWVTASLAQTRTNLPQLPHHDAASGAEHRLNKLSEQRGGPSLEEH